MDYILVLLAVSSFNKQGSQQVKMTPATNGAVTPVSLLHTLEQHAFPTPTVPDILSLSGKTIAITGGGRGLGMALAYAVVESGGHVVCLDILPTPSETEWPSLLKLCKESNLSASYQRCDVTSGIEIAEALETIAQNADESEVPFAGVIACAGLQQKVPALHYDAQDFERILRVNVTGTFLTAKLTARILVEKKRPGSIVLISSMSGQIANRVRPP